MVSNHTNVRATNPNGQQLSVQHTTTDSPILPAGNLQQLQAIDPALVQWVVNQTEIEATHRRKETTRVNGFIFWERISGVIAGGVIALAGLLVSGYLAINGHDWVAVGIGGATLAAIVAVLVTRKHPGPSQEQTPPKNQKRRR